MNEATGNRAPLDEIDIAILALLRDDARRTVTDIAGRVNLSLAPVKRRIDRLEKSGVILGYTARIDQGALEPHVDVYCRMRLSGVESREVADWLLHTFTEVTSVVTVAGEDDFLIHLQVESVERLNILLDEFRRQPGVAATRTMIAMQTFTRESPPIGPCPPH